MKPRAAEVYLRPSNLGGLAKAQRLGASLRFSWHCTASHRTAVHLATVRSAVTALRRYGHVYCTSTYMRPIPDMMGDAP